MHEWLCDAGFDDLMRASGLLLLVYFFLLETEFERGVRLGGDVLMYLLYSIAYRYFKYSSGYIDSRMYRSVHTYTVVCADVVGLHGDGDDDDDTLCCSKP